MDGLAAFEHHLTSPQGLGLVPAGAFTATVGGGDCCDTVTIHLATDGRHITAAGFEAHGCGAATAAGSAVVTLVRGATILDAARIGPREIARELGGLSPGKLHAAEVAADALARALGAAAGKRGAQEAPTGERQAPTLVAMSGGVDSAVAALLCAQDGPTAAVTLELWADAENDAERSCCSASAVAQARALAHRLGLPHFTLDLRDEFRAGVVEPFIDSYAAGETPNPCVRCNGHVRLDAMLALADRLGCATLATGHYARVEEGLLRCAADPAKDQTYMLTALSLTSLARMRFPLGDLTKPEVRELAARAGLPVAAKQDSQDLCFLAGTSRSRFLERHAQLRPRPGEIVDAAGACSAGTAGTSCSQSASAAASASPATASRSTCSTRTPAAGRVVVGPRGAREPTGSASRRPAAPSGRARRPRQAPLPVAPAACAPRRRPAGGPPPDA